MVVAKTEGKVLE